MKFFIILAFLLTPVSVSAQSADSVMHGIIRDAAIDNNKPRAGYCRYEGFRNWWYKILTCYKRDTKGNLVRYYAKGF